MFPSFPSLQDSLAFCQQKLEARCLRLPSRTPNFQACRNTRRGRWLPGAFDAREQSFRVVSVAHAQNRLQDFRGSSTGQFSEVIIPHFPPGCADEVIE